jgi:hypothetical protein
MKISKTVNYTITFSVQAYWSEEGGMGHSCHSEGWNELIDAIAALEYAENNNPDHDWEIIANVAKVVRW